MSTLGGWRWFITWAVWMASLLTAVSLHGTASIVALIVALICSPLLMRRDW